MTALELICIGCNQAPENIPDVCSEARIEGMTPSEWVLAEEGTLNRTNGHFYCTPCFLAWEAKHDRRFIGVAP